MDEKTIKEVLRKGERVTLECKRAKADVPKSVWATYSAFANTIGGLILLGPRAARTYLVRIKLPHCDDCLN